MKLASYKDGSRDGQLVVVSRDLRYAHFADHIAPTLQAVLDDWEFLAPQLETLFDALNQEDSPQNLARHRFAFDPRQCMAPLPRAYQWADGSAYVNHVELVRKARGAELPPEFWTVPIMYQGGSDDFLGPTDNIICVDEDHGIDFEGEVAVITGDIAMGATPQQAAENIRLLLLVNDVSLRHLIPEELAKGFGFLQSKPASAFSPVAVTPDELGAAWQDNKVHLPLTITWNKKKVGSPLCGEDMVFDFGQLIAHLCRTRNVRAGSIIGSGTISNIDRSRGYACIAEKRMLETIESGQATTEFMKFGDTIKIEMLNAQGHSIFGAIEQTIVSLNKNGEMHDAQPLFIDA